MTILDTQVIAELTKRVASLEAQHAHQLVNFEEYSKAVSEAEALKAAAKEVIADLGHTKAPCLKKLNEALHPLVAVKKACDGPAPAERTDGQFDKLFNYEAITFCGKCKARMAVIPIHEVADLNVCPNCFRVSVVDPDGCHDIFENEKKLKSEIERLKAEADPDALAIVRASAAADYQKEIKDLRNKLAEAQKRQVRAGAGIEDCVGTGAMIVGMQKENADLRAKLEEAQNHTPHNYVHKQVFAQVTADLRFATDRANKAEHFVEELTHENQSLRTRLEAAEGSRDPNLSYVTLVKRNENLKARILILEDEAKRHITLNKQLEAHIENHYPNGERMGVNRWNIVPRQSGALEVCKGDHDKHEPCKFEVFVPYAEVARRDKVATGRLLKALTVLRNIRNECATEDGHDMSSSERQVIMRRYRDDITTFLAEEGKA